ARTLGIRLTRVAITARGDFSGAPQVSSGIDYSIEVWGEAGADALRGLVERVDAVAEIPNSLRRGTAVRLAHARVHGTEERQAGPGAADEER
ncbi:MAG TPA: hypothetical protein VLQ79_12570, partial [Myxococcaceae bacterium]|nr:hypothetical protein [Myxococcaceae bacterium]